jgi:hypothetical protein
MRSLPKSFLPILVALVLLLSVARSGQAQSGARLSSKPPALQSHKPTANHRNDVDERRPPQIVKSPFEAEIVEALRAITREQQTSRAEDQANEKRWWPPSPSWAIVYVTVIYVGVAIFQWFGIYRQANIAQRALVLGERPYLRLSRSTLNIGNLNCDIAVTNDGRNFAFVVDSNWAFVVTDSPDRPANAPTYQRDNPVGRLGRVNIGSNRHNFISARGDFQAADMDDFKAERRYVHLFAYVDYGDALGKSIHHSEIGILMKFDQRPAGYGLQAICPTDHTYAEDT